MLSFVLFVSCNSQKKTEIETVDEDSMEIETVHVSFEDSTIYAHVAITGDFPLAKNYISGRICDSLITMLDDCLGNPSYSEKHTIVPYTSTDKDWKKLVKHYGKAILKQFSAEANIDENGRLSFATEDSFDDYFPRWEYQMEVIKTCQHKNYVVFSCNNYIYLGGAHGGSGGLGDVVFDLRDGNHFTNFLKPNIVRQIQPLLRKGLLEYFSADTEPITDSELNDQLMLYGNEIPMPSLTPSPSKKGLTFVYGQYEIACYAAGMPSFTIPYHDLLPYLTDEAKDLLDLKEENE